MCATLVTKDGIKPRTLGEARRYAIDVPDRALVGPEDETRCLCPLDLPAVLAGHSSRWREGFAMPGDGWCEVGDDGRTWWEGFDIQIPIPGSTRGVGISRSDCRSDCRSATTLAEWESARGDEPSGAR